MTKKLDERLRKFDINANAYKRSPLGKEVFAIGIDRTPPSGIVRAWEGKADIEVFGSKKYRQAVINVEEPKRKIERSIKVREYVTSGAQSTSNEWLRRRALGEFRNRVFIPGRNRVVAKKISVNDDGTWRTHTFKVVASMEESSSSLLTGMDETYHFISALPQSASSVKEAHEILRPDVAPNSKRQGEWFFEPCDKDLRDTLHEVAKNKIKNGGSISPTWWTKRYPMRDSTHEVSVMLEYMGQHYTFGYVKDTRRMHHEPLFLPDWHRIVRNNEVTTPNPARRRNWD